MSDDFLRILVYSSAFSVTIPLLSFIRLRRLSGPYKILFLYLILGLCTELCGYYFVVIKRQNNIALDHYFRFIEGALLSGIFWLLFGWDRWKYFVFIIGLLSLRIILHWAFNDSENNLIPGNAYREDLAKTIFELILKSILAVFAVYYYYRLFEEAQVPSLLKYGMFWINNAIVFYFGVEMFFDTFRELMRVSPNIARQLFPIHLVTNLLFHAMLTIGIWTSNRR